MANQQLLAAWSMTTTAQEKHAHRNSQSYTDSPRSRWEAAALAGYGGGYVPNTSQVEAKLTDAVRAEIETFSPAEQLVVLTQFQDMYQECEDEQTWQAFLNTWLNFGRHFYGNEELYATKETLNNAAQVSN